VTAAAALLAEARALVERGDRVAAGLWPRAAALLGRQALEAGMDELWRRRAPEVAELSARAQLTCLPEYLRDERLAGEVAFTWSQLSNACHHRGYDTGPTAPELRARFDVLERLVARLEVAAR
jgi:hypothetical protein